MDLKQDILNFLKLAVLLYFLCWSLSWNWPKELDGQFSSNRVSRTSRRIGVNSNPILNKHSVVLESFKNVRRMEQWTQTKATILPPFNAWKENQLQYEIKEKNEEGSLSSTSRRKLNYASSKCGAKIVSSNPEAMGSSSVLNEKGDQYMLNPCRAETWFVIELCDTIEADQIEIANYELYSSSPKQFSTFSSTVFPTQAWKHIGTFEPQNTRHKQLFGLIVPNIGKFIKILISSHHGKEHYCPLSVVRIMGYSMVYEYDDVAESKYPEKASKLGSKKISQSTALSKRKSGQSNLEKIAFLKKNSYLKNLFSFRHVLHQYQHKHKPKCFRKISKTRRLDFKTLMYLFNANKTTCSKITNYALRDFKGRGNTAQRKTVTVDGISNLTSAEDINKTHNEGSARLKKIVDTKVMKNDHKLHHKYSHHLLRKDHQIGSDESPEDKFIDEAVNVVDNSARYSKEVIDEDSAARAQKDSVLVKLNSRIRDSEKNLAMINAYLQQLSQAYRHEMDEMQVMFNQTVGAMNSAAQKALLIDEQQQISIDLLERKIRALNFNVEDLENGQHNLLEKVMELHGFFLILELIILCMLFSALLSQLKEVNYAEKRVFPLLLYKSQYIKTNSAFFK